MPEEFKAITSQEQFDSMVGERLKRAEEKYASKYADYEDLKKKNETYEKQLNELNLKLKEASDKAINYDKTIGEKDATIKAYETNSVKMRIAHEYGIPFELSDRLNGDDEEAIRKDAEAFKAFVSSPKPQPLATSEVKEESKDKGLRDMLRKLDTK